MEPGQTKHLHEAIARGAKARDRAGVLSTIEATAERHGHVTRIARQLVIGRRRFDQGHRRAWIEERVRIAETELENFELCRAKDTGRSSPPFRRDHGTATASRPP